MNDTTKPETIPPANTEAPAPAPLPVMALPPALPPAGSTRTNVFASRPPTPPAEPVCLDHEPDIHSWGGLLDALLKHPNRVLAGITRATCGRLTAQLLVLAFLGMAAYGVVVGLFPGGKQIAVAPLKLAGGLLASAAICWPSLFILLCLSGARQSAREVIGLLASTLALIVILLVGFAPVAWVFTQSTHAVGFMAVLHLILWFISAVFALNRLSQGLVALNGVTMQMFPIWCVIFLIVCLQMTTTLRPILGPFTGWELAPRAFFLQHWFGM